MKSFNTEAKTIKLGYKIHKEIETTRSAMDVMRNFPYPFLLQALERQGKKEKAEELRIFWMGQDVFQKMEAVICRVKKIDHTGVEMMKEGYAIPMEE